LVSLQILCCLDYNRQIMRTRKRVLIVCLAVFLAASLYAAATEQAAAKKAAAEKPAQIPTGAIPTVTSTPSGAYIIVLESEQGFANLRSGPNTTGYDVVGVLVAGQQAPALGVSAGGDWVQVVYPGVPGGVAWVYAPLVDIQGNLSIVEPPPTSTPRTTPTIDPTLASQFLIEIPPTRMPTYTPPPPLVLPTLPAEQPVTQPGRVPMGMVIIVLAAFGFLGLLISFIRGR
jgi:hypothetical protein